MAKEPEEIHVQEQTWHYGRRFLITTEGASVHLEIYDEPLDEYQVQAYIGALWVEEPYRRNGLARKLLRKAEEIAKAEGMSCVFLEWRKVCTLSEIARWYEREGYDDVAFDNHGTYVLYRKNLKGGKK